VIECFAGQEELAAPTSSTDRTCQNCELGVTFNNATGGFCQNVTECPANTTQVAEPTLTSDRICNATDGQGGQDRRRRDADPSPCGQSQFAVVVPPALDCNSTVENCTDTIECRNLTTCDPLTEIEETAPTNTSDRVCGCVANAFRNGTACTICSAGTFLVRENVTSLVNQSFVEEVTQNVTNTTTNVTTSVPANVTQFRLVNETKLVSRCEVCPLGQFQPEAGQTACLPVRDLCGPGSEETSAPTAETDRVCTPCEPGAVNNATNGACVACDAGTFASSNLTCTPCNATDFQDQPGQVTCQPQPDCPVGTFVSRNASLDQQRLCEPCGNGTFADQVNAAACSPFLECTSDQFEVSPPSRSNDRQCKQLTECPEQFFRVL
jgi:hypothetical protein